MTQSEHTKGPWEFRKDDCWTIFADGSSIMGDIQYYPWVPDNEADWHLIAAAPQLLAALRMIVQLNPELPMGCIEDAEAAIAKATGA